MISLKVSGNFVKHLILTQPLNLLLISISENFQYFTISLTGDIQQIILNSVVKSWISLIRLPIRREIIL